MTHIDIRLNERSQLQVSMLYDSSYIKFKNKQKIVCNCRVGISFGGIWTEWDMRKPTEVLEMFYILLFPPPF